MFDAVWDTQANSPGPGQPVWAPAHRVGLPQDQRVDAVHQQLAAAGVGDQHPAQRIGGQGGRALAGAQCLLDMTVGADRRHRSLPSIQDNGRISLCHKGIDACKDLVAALRRSRRCRRRWRRGKGVYGAVGAAQHQLAVGASRDRGEFGLLGAGDTAPARAARRQVDREVAATGGQVGRAAAVAGQRGRRPRQGDDTRRDLLLVPNTARLAGAAGSAPGVSTASAWVPPSKTAAAACAAQRSHRAGRILRRRRRLGRPRRLDRGRRLASSGLDEQPATSVSKAIRSTANRAELDVPLPLCVDSNG